MARSLPTLPCKRCNRARRRCHCRKGNRASRKPAGGAAIVRRYGMPESEVRRRRAAK